jgi:ABC-2 type transport system permease protein
MRLFVHELRGELQLYSRSRELAFFTFMLPLIFFVLLGSVYGSGDKINGYDAADYLLTGMIGYGVIATAFAGLAIVLVIRRENGVLKRLRATPLPASFYIAAVLLTTLIAFAVMAACLIALGMILFGASFPKAPASLVLTLLLGGACFAALGVAITGFIRRAEGASAVINAIYLPVAFISGAFFSRQHFPEVLQKVADALPLTYFIDLVGDVMLKGTQIWNEPKDLAVILVWGVAGTLLALRYFRWVPRED